VKKANSEQLLQLLADRGEMNARDFLEVVPRPDRTYVDFYPVAALLHAGYISTDTTVTLGGTKIAGKLGLNTHETSVFLCTLTLKAGETFEVDGAQQNSAHDFDVRIFITSEGYLRLDELAERRAERSRKRIDYLIALGVAIVAALLSSYLTHYFAAERQRAERTLQGVAPTTYFERALQRLPEV
jgi:hypothetical protein